MIGVWGKAFPHWLEMDASRGDPATKQEAKLRAKKQGLILIHWPVRLVFFGVVMLIMRLMPARSTSM